MFLSC